MRGALRLGPNAPFRRLVGIGGIGAGMFLALEGDRTLGRNESRAARLIDARDYCKLHIIAHHVAVLLGADPSGRRFHVAPVGAVGDDETGRRLLAEMAAVGIDTSHVAVVDRPTLFSVCLRYPDGSGGNLTTVDSAAASLTVAAVDAAEPLLAADGPRTIALAAPEVGLDCRRRMLELATAHGALRAASFTSAEVGPAREDGTLALVDVLALNEEEARALSGLELDPDRPEPVLDACARAAPGARLVITAGAAGAIGFEEGRWARRRPPAVRAVSAAGAGDALLAGVLAATAAGVPFLPAEDDDAPLSSALDLGVLLAAHSVTSPHTIHPDAGLERLLELARTTGRPVVPPLADAIGRGET